VAYRSASPFRSSDTSPIYRTDGTPSDLFERIDYYGGETRDEPHGADVSIYKADALSPMGIIHQSSAGERQYAVSPEGEKIGVTAEESFLPIYPNFEANCDNEEGDKLTVAGQPSSMLRLRTEPGALGKSGEEADDAAETLQHYFANERIKRMSGDR